MREYYVVNPQRWFEYCALVTSPIAIEVACRRSPGMEVGGEGKGKEGGGEGKGEGEGKWEGKGMWREGKVGENRVVRGRTQAVELH